MIFLILVPFFTTIFGLTIYRFQGKKKEFLSLDLVQFIYLFFMTPLLFVWLKTFLFYLLKNELGNSLSLNQIFVIDTVFTLLAYFVFAALGIHALTKTFWLKRHHDPLFDLFHLSEYFHLWWSHIMIWGGVMLLLSFVSIANVFAPIPTNNGNFTMMFVGVAGLAAGMALFFSIWNSDPGQGSYMRVMKLLLIFCAMLHLVAYFIFDPRLHPSFGWYWFGLTLFTSAATVGGLLERNKKVNHFRRWSLHAGWGNNIKIFKKK